MQKNSCEIMKIYEPSNCLVAWKVEERFADSLSLRNHSKAGKNGGPWGECTKTKDPLKSS